MPPLEVDVLQIGAGQATSCIMNGVKSAGLAYRIAERKDVGGSCVNFGCTPTKAVLASARLLHLARRACEFGLRIPNVEADFPEVLRQARALAEHSRQSMTESIGEQLIRGHARFQGRNGDRFRVTIGDHEVLAKNVVLDTGTRAKLPKVEGLDQVPCLDGANWLFHDDLPPRLAILGGGYISVEMGQFYARMGSQVTIIDRGPQILQQEDPEVAKAVQEALENDGIGFLLNTSFDRVVPANPGWRLTCGPEDLEMDAIFIATGRQPNTADLGLETIGLKPDEKGILKVDEYLQTAVEGIYAVGDIRGGPMFTQTAWDDGRIVAGALTSGGRSTKGRVIPYAVFTDPQVARVGLNEHEAKEEGIAFEVKTFPMAYNAAAQEDRACEGMIRLLVSPDDNLLGATIVAEHAAEMIQAYAQILTYGGSLKPLRDGLVTHPSYMEAVQNVIL